MQMIKMTPPHGYGNTSINGVQYIVVDGVVEVPPNVAHAFFALGYKEVSNELVVLDKPVSKKSSSSKK